MNKINYLWVLFLISFRAMAQIDPYDSNWESIINDNFSNDSWNTYSNWLICHPTGYYRTYLPEWGSGVSRGSDEHQVYQRGNVEFGNGRGLKLKSYYVGGDPPQPLMCGNYDIPSGYTCDTSHHTLFYKSGCVETTDQFLYGYFEIKCSLPIHTGSFPAFWLYGEGSNYYNEIDIFEYSNGIVNQDYYKQFSCGLYCDNTHHAPSDFELLSQARVTPILPYESEDLTHPHVFACEWLPEHVAWYVDGIMVNEYSYYDSIPHHPMVLKINYAINNYAVPDHGVYMNQPIWRENDEMKIEYLKVLQLQTDCDTDVLINNVYDLVTYQPSVKKSIVIQPSNELTTPTNTNLNMRAVDSIVIKNGFTLPIGSQITLQTQMCPE